MRVQMITQDAKMILAAAPPDNWKRPPGRPRIMWLNTIQRHLRTYNITLNEAVEPSSVQADVCVWRYALRTPSGACQNRRRRA